MKRYMSNALRIAHDADGLQLSTRCQASVTRMTRPGAEALAAERRKDAPTTSGLYHLKPQETLCTGLGSD
jgi:hypothetical protein